MVNFKKDKNGKYHFTASLGFDKRTGKRVQKNVEGLKQVLLQSFKSTIK